MTYDTIQMETAPALTEPVLIIGLRGWGNALDVSAGMAGYLVETLPAERVGMLDSDRCYRYDASRPVVKIQAGRLHSIDPPEGTFFAVATPPGQRDLLVLIADEPSLNWYRFCGELVDLAQELGAPSVISLGSMMDNVLHTDRIVSALSTAGDFEGAFRRHGVIPINYHGPSAIHTLILEACRKRALTGASLWGHCPAYLQGISHHGMMHQLGRLLTDMAGFVMDTDPLAARWEALEAQIRRLISENPKIEAVMDKIRRQKRQGVVPQPGTTGRQEGKVINLQDFLDP